jgi:hypothetical protein
MIKVYFVYQDIKCWFIRVILGELLSDETIRTSEGDVFCVFLLYQKYNIPDNVLNVMRELNENGVQIIVVSNLKLNSVAKAEISPYIKRLIIRRNIGRDFGGYRYGVLKVLDDYDPERLIILNDSVFYRREGLKEFISEMLKDRDFIGVAENYEFQYHVGSYALSLGKKIISDKRFRQYWKRYKLSEVRPKVIKRGEMGLNKLIINKIGVKPYVIYSPYKLQDAIKKKGFDQLIDAYAAMPSKFISVCDDNIFERLSSIAEEWYLSSGEEISRFVGNDKLSLEMADELFVRITRVRAVSDLIGISKDEIGKRVSDYNKEEITKEIIDFAMQGSQIHWAAALLVSYLNCPLIKNDLVVRLIYSPAELHYFAKYMSSDEYTEFLYIQTNRGVPTIHWKGFKRAMLMLGYI